MPAGIAQCGNVAMAVKCMMTSGKSPKSLTMSSSASVDSEDLTVDSAAAAEIDLLQAAAEGDLALLKACLRHEAAVARIDDTNASGRTLLHVAVTYVRDELSRTAAVCYDL